MSSIKFNSSLIAHRGASAYAPENTLAAFLKAKQLGATWVEFDVMLAACGEAIIIHDQTLDRTTNGSGDVSRYAYDELSRLDAGSWFDPAFSGEKIPTFKSVLHFLQAQQLAANIEIKAEPGYEEATVIKILSDINDHWTIDKTQLLISSFSLPVLRCVRKHAPAALIGLLADNWFSNWEEVAQELQCIAINIDHDMATQEKIAKIHARKQFVLCYTVNDAKRAKQLFSWGVDGIFTDDLCLISSPPKS